MAGVIELLSRQLKRARAEGAVPSMPSEDDKLLFQVLLEKYSHDEYIQAQVLPYMTREEEGTYFVQPPQIEKLLLFLLKKERQENEEKLTFESFHVKDAENQNVLLREQMNEQKERIDFLQKQVETTEKLRTELDAANRSLFSIIRERNSAQDRVNYIAEEVRKAHEQKLEQGREKAMEEVALAVESFKRLADEMSGESEEYKRRMAEIVDQLRLCVAINL